MLKKFFISMLGSIAGFWISLAIACFALLGVLGAIVASSSDSKSTKISKGSVLYLDLSGEMRDRNQDLDFMQILRGGDIDSDALVDYIDAIDLAATDSRIDGIYIKADGSVQGTATREEIINALNRFKQSGKWIYAYADGYSQGDYLLASVADEVILNPVGSVDVHGVATMVPFFKDLLDKIGVKMQIVRVGTFKSAVEPFMGNSMSDASRMMNQVMVDSLWQYMAGTIATNRDVTLATVNQWADSLLAFYTPAHTVDAGAVNSLMYERQVNDKLRELLDLDSSDDLPLVSPSELLANRTSNYSEKSHIAVLFAEGDIVDSGDGGIVGDKMTPEIIALADDDNVAAMVLRVNSGGGSAFASEQIWEAIQYFKSKDKPVYVSMGDYAASGGYYISCGADCIYADRTTLTGSIGVFGMIPDFSGLVTDKLGVHFSTVETNPNATFPGTMTGMTPEQHAIMQRSVNQTYEIFTSRVAEGRGMSQDSVKAIAEGRVWVGGQALQLGLVDRIGGLYETIHAMADHIDLDPDRVVYYPKVSDQWFNQIVAEARRNVSAGSVSIDAEAANILRLLNQIRTQNPVQARMEPVEIR